MVLPSGEMPRLSRPPGKFVSGNPSALPPSLKNALSGRREVVTIVPSGTVPQESRFVVDNRPTSTDPTYATLLASGCVPDAG